MFPSSKRNRIRYDRESKIIIVDKDDNFLKFFKIHLNKFFSKVHATSNPHAALEWFQNEGGDILVTNMSMPRLNGLQFLKKAKKIDPAVPVILISDTLLDAEHQKELDLSDAFIKKPLDLDEFHFFLKKGLRKRKKLKELSTYVNSATDFRALVNGQANAEKMVAKDDLEKAKVLLFEIEDKAA